jgi:hypothetical protein
MPASRPDAPFVEVFTPDELLVLNEWFGVKLSRSEEWPYGRGGWLIQLDDPTRKMRKTMCRSPRSTAF